MTDKLAQKNPVYETTNYAQFKMLPGNRQISSNWVADLTKAILQENLLAENPILVNKDMFVIDGQHRLEVAKNNNLAIFYIIGSGNLKTVQDLNAKRRPWNGNDYLDSYIQLGNKEYVVLREYMEQYNLPINRALILITGGSGGTWGRFKRGELKIPNTEEVDAFLQAYFTVRPYATPQAWTDREFILAFRRLLRDISIEEFVVKLDSSGIQIDRFVSVKDYLREFERVLNFKRRDDNHVRLF